MCLEPTDVNSLGLLFDIAGAWLVATEVVKQFKGKKYENDPTWDGIGRPPWDTDEYKKWESRKFKFMWSGLICLTVGFSLQITSNYLKSNHIKTYPLVIDKAPTNTPVTNDHDKLQLLPDKADRPPIQNKAIKKN
jgi:hypothetical protein